MAECRKFHKGIQLLHKKFYSQYIQILMLMLKGSFNEIKGEALEDMSIFKSLVSGRFIRGSTDKEYLGESDNRKFSPFFLLINIHIWIQYH